MKRTKIISAAIWLGTISSILFVILIVHLAIVGKHKNNDLRNRQLSRIDFKNNINQTEANKIRTYVSKLEGVESTYFNIDNGILVYTYQTEKQNSKNVFEKLMKIGKYTATPYTISKEEAKSGCPISPNSMTYKVTAYLTNIIN